MINNLNDNAWNENTYYDGDVVVQFERKAAEQRRHDLDELKEMQTSVEKT